MRYALLLYADVDAARAASRSEADDELARYGGIAQDLADEGVLRGGEAFLPAARGFRVQATPAGATTSQVPSAALELSGFLVVECAEERATEIAASLPVAAHGQVEVRPLLDVPPPT